MEIEKELRLTDIFLKKDPVRWVAGALAGLFAGIVMLAFWMVLTKIQGGDLLAPIKYAALPVYGSSALESGMNPAVGVGLVLHLLVCMVQGAVYAHVTGTNACVPLLGVGITFGTFSWIFINNLFTPSFRTVFVSGRSLGEAFFAWIVFGIALVSVMFFDKALRRKA